MTEHQEPQDLRSLAEDIRRQTESWPSSMRAPVPGSDVMWERVLSGTRDFDRLEDHSNEG